MTSLPLAQLLPLALAAEAVLFAALLTSVSRRRARARALGGPENGYLIHAINDDRCTGCESCVSACPTNVLELISHKSRVLRFEDCVQCEACARSCPTTALVMFPVGCEPPDLDVPDLDESFQTRVPGQYLIGEVAGKPLVKNAANLGRLVVEHMLSEGLRPGGADVDVAIVGSGPGGLSAALTCLHHGLSYVVLEKEQVVASTVARYPKGKPFMAEPTDCRNLSFLPVYDSTKEELVAAWQSVVEQADVQIHRGEAVETIDRGGDGVFTVKTTVNQYRAQRIVLATGLRGKPRTLGIPGENLPKVHSLLEDADDYSGQHALVVGGGDSALEAAIALEAAGARVTIAYRSRSFSRAKKPNRDTIDDLSSAGRIDVYTQCNPSELTADEVVLAMADGSTKRVPNDVAFVLIGADMPVKWLGKLGVEFVKRPHSYELGATDALVEALIGAADECPTDPRRAVARVFGAVAPADDGSIDVEMSVETGFDDQETRVFDMNWCRSYDTGPVQRPPTFL